MATRDEYINQGYTNEQIDSAFLNKMATGEKTNVAPGAPTPTLAPTGMASATSGIVQNATPTPAMQAQVNPIEANIGGKLPQTQITPPTTPVVTTQAITTPTQVEKTTTTTPQGEKIVKKETPGVDTVELKRNADENRQREILGNLNEGFANAPDLFQDQDTFRNAYGYATADDTKKKTLDAFFQAKSSQINNPDALFQQIAINQPIYNPEIKRTPAYQKALSRFNDLNINAGLTTNELSDKIRDGSINMGSQAYTDLQMKNPELIRKAEMLNYINTGKGNAKVDGNAVLTNVSGNITKDVAKEDISNYQNMLAGNTQVVDALTKKLETETKINSLQDTLDNLETDIRNDLKGKGKSEGYIQALISEKSKPIVRQLSTLGRTYSSQLANLQYYSDMVKEDYNTQKDERKTASDRAYEAQKDSREFGQQKELAQFQQELGLQENQAEFEQQMKQKAQIANDPVMATQYIIDTYAKLGILPERSNAEIIQSVQNDIASGMTLGQSLTNLNKAFQSKPQYQSIVSPKTTQFKPNIEKISENEYGYFDSKGNLVRVNPKASTGGSWMETIGDGKVTFLGGRVQGDYGMDIAGPEGFDVTSPVSGTILSGGSHKDYGVYVEIKAEDGSRVRLSHLDPEVAQTLNMGGKINAGDFIGKQSNTGTVIAPKGRGVLDVTTWDANGKVRTGEQTQTYLGMGGDTQEIGQSDFMIFNSSTFKPQSDLKTNEDKKKYKLFLEEKNKVMGDKNASIQDILRYSAGGKDLDATSITSLDKFDSALSQINVIQEQISDMKTGFILGRIRKLNPYDTDAQVLKAQLTALIPNLARGVYGEVGVLTDNDIRIYSETIPNLTQTDDVNNAILAMTLKVVAGGYKKKLQSLAAAGRDVSGFSGLYDSLMGQVESIETNLGIGKNKTSTTATGKSGTKYTIKIN